MAEPARRDPVGPARLPDEEVRARLVRLEETLELIEKTPGPAGELALSAVAELAHIYGEALARAVDHAAAAQQPELLDALVRDELIDHLMVLHEIHPEPLEPRVERAIAQLRPAIEERGGRITLRGIEHDVATVELTIEGCGSTAQGMHDASPRRAFPFVAVNCAAFPETLLESELFGYEEGAFTGARRGGKAGLFESAHNGTLFLDEVGDMPPALQTRLLRVLQEKQVLPIGGLEAVPVNVRVIAATHRDLAQRVSEGTFRQDLYYRLSVLQIHLPPLRDRPEDIAPLARMLMKFTSAQIGVPPLDLTPAILVELERYSWPGNVRELRNVIERSLILGSFPEDIVTGNISQSEANPDALAAIERGHMLKVLEAAGGNRAEAARRLGISRKTLDRKCAAWNV